MRTLVVLSDSHVNSTVGLAKPTIQLDDGDQVSASTARRWLYWTFTDILTKVKEKARGDLYGILNGDVIEADTKRRSWQVISKSPADIQKMAVETFEPFFEMCKGIWVTRGTEAHTGKSAHFEETFAGNFDNTMRNEETGQASWWHLPLEIEGVKIDVAHHPRGGSGRPMNSQSGIDRVASDTLFAYANDGETPPHLVIRSHLHGYRDSRDAFRTRAIITPAMSLLTSYVYRIGINASMPVGAILIYVDKGRYFVEPILYPVRKTEWQTIP